MFIKSPQIKQQLKQNKLSEFHNSNHAGNNYWSTFIHISIRYINKGVVKYLLLCNMLRPARFSIKNFW